MEQRAPFILTGIFLLVSIAALIWGVLWLGERDLQSEGVVHAIRFEGSVSGLRIGNSVRYQGVQVGSVKDIMIDTENPGKILVLIEIQPEAPVTEGIVGSLEYQGITGIAFVQLSGGGGDKIVAKDGEKYPAIESKKSQLETLFAETPELIQRITGLVDRANLILNDDNRGEIARILANVGTISDQFAAASGNLPNLFTEAENALGSLARVSDEAAAILTPLADRSEDVARNIDTSLENFAAFSKDLPATISTVTRTFDSIGTLADDITPEIGTLSEETLAAIKEFRQNAAAMKTASDRISGTAEQATVILEDNRQAIGDFFENGLYEFSLLVSELRTLARSLNRVSTELERDPPGYLFGDKNRGYEIK